VLRAAVHSRTCCRKSGIDPLRPAVSDRFVAKKTAKVSRRHSTSTILPRTREGRFIANECIMDRSNFKNVILSFARAYPITAIVAKRLMYDPGRASKDKR
jgi:hypothetical protein